MLCCGPLDCTLQVSLQACTTAGPLSVISCILGLLLRVSLPLFPGSDAVSRASWLHPTGEAAALGTLSEFTAIS